MAAMAAATGSVAFVAPSKASTMGGRVESVHCSSLSLRALVPASDSRSGAMCASHMSSHFNVRVGPKKFLVCAMATEVEPDAELGDSAPPAAERPAKLYVGNLPFNVDSESLAEIFQDFGSVELVEVIHDRVTGQSRGFAFVTMTSQADAQAAIDKLDGSELGGRPMRVNFPQTGPRENNRSTDRRGPRDDRRSGGDSKPRGGANSANKLYVGNLSWGMDDLGLEDLFSEFGKVLEAKIVVDRDTGRSRGFGFVTLSSRAEVEEAIGGLDGVEVDGRQIRVNVAESKPVGRSFQKFER